MSEHPHTAYAGGTATADAAASGRLMRAATYAAVSVASILILAKLAAWIATDSLAILGSLIDSILDAAASLINFVAVRHSLAPADAEHRFGHGKAEALAALGQAAFISGSAVFLLFEAGSRMVHQPTVTNGTIGMSVMAFAIVLTFALVQFQRYVVRRTGSLAIRADSLHYKGDLLMNVSVIAALMLVYFLDWPYADQIFAVGIALYLLYNAWEIIKGAFDQLMDREFPDETRGRIRDIALGHAEVRDMHDLRTRASGTGAFIQLHLELDGEISLADAHTIADEVEAKIRAAFPGAEVIIHQDPAGLDEGHVEFAS